MRPTCTLPSLLATKARSHWEEFCTALDKADLDGPADKDLAATIETLFGFSDFIALNCIRNPELLVGLLRTGELMRPYGPEEFDQKVAAVMAGLGDDASAAADEKKMATETLARGGPGDSGEAHFAMLQKALRRLRQREMVRIAFRDLAGWADLDETVGELSALADASIQHTLFHLHNSMSRTLGVPRSTGGQPQSLVVLGMGKLGARELNFSSDIDLMFAFPQRGETDGTPPIPNQDFFVRLSRRLIAALGATTENGFVFRVDLRLRPFGDSGPLAMNFDNMEDYYQTQGREWERYALIKARVVAGDKEAGEELLARLRPFIYRRYLDFGAFESLRDMKQKIALEVRRQKLQADIKLGPGGIREIEFFGQIFQLIRGGVLPDLQEPRIRTVLAILDREGLIPDATRQILEEAYIFLRRVEHRLQAFADRQTHRLPTDDTGCLRLSAAMGYSGWDLFEKRLAAIRKGVQAHFDALLETGGQRDDHGEPTNDSMLKSLEGVWLAVFKGDEALHHLATAGFEDPEEISRQLENHRQTAATRAMSRAGMERLNKLIPLVLAAVVQSDGPQSVLGRLLDLITAIQRRTSYLALLLEYPTALTHLVRLAGASPWIITFLSRHPVLLDELLDARTLYRLPRREALARQLHTRMQRLAREDLEYQMEALRVFRQVNTLHVAASDITDRLPLMKVSDHLSDLAEVILGKVVELSWRYLVAKHGAPTCRLGDRVCDQGFVVVAYGKLGGLELGYSSDLDLVFLHAAAPGQTSGGSKPLDNAHFFTRLGQRVIHILTAHTAAGILYEVDMRLRPSGDSGVLVSHVHGFRDYQLEDAWTWEHQALIRARAVAGDPALIEHFDALRREVLTVPRAEKALRGEVVAMRQKMRQGHPAPTEGLFDIKQDRGGIVDIEFLVQYLVLLKSLGYPELLQWTDNVRLLQTLAESGVIDNTTAHLLRRAYLIYRAAVHRLNLKERSAVVDAEPFAELRNFVESTWHAILEA